MDDLDRSEASQTVTFGLDWRVYHTDEINELWLTESSSVDRPTTWAGSCRARRKLPGSLGLPGADGDERSCGSADTPLEAHEASLLLGGGDDFIL